MKAELLKKEGNVVTLKITVDYDKFNGAVEKAYKKLEVDTAYLDSEKVKLLEK